MDSLIGRLNETQIANLFSVVAWSSHLGLGGVFIESFRSPFSYVMHRSARVDGCYANNGNNAQPVLLWSWDLYQ